MSIVEQVELMHTRRDRAPWWLRGLGRLVWRWRWQLTPYTVMGAAVVAGWAGAVVWRLWPGWSYAAAGACGLVALAWVTLGLRDGYERGLGAVAVLAAGGYAAAIARHPLDIALYPLGPIVATVLGIPWWWGGMRRLVELDRWRRRIESTRLGREGARLVGFTRTATARVFRLRMPGRKWTAQDREQFAIDLGHAPGALFAETDPRHPTAVTVRTVDVQMFGGPEIPHPALTASATQPGGQWTPGSCSILDPIPLGTGQDDTPRTLRLYAGGDARHFALFGQNGSGKSGTLSVMLARLAACRDAVLVGSDTPKGGQTLLPWRPVFARLATTADDTRALLADLLTEIAARGPVLVRNRWSKWRPSNDHPSIVCVIEEAAALFSAEPEIADQATDIVRLGRSVGVLLGIVSQGTTYASIPTTLRNELKVLLAHYMPESELRYAWPAAAGLVDMSLFEVPGLVYLNDGGGDKDVSGLLPVRSFALYEPDDQARLAEVYGPHRPALRLQSGQTTTTTTTTGGKVPEQRGEARARVDAAVREAAERVDADVSLPDGDPAEVFAWVAEQPGPESAEDEQVTARVLDALAKAGRQGASSSDLAAAAGCSQPTVIRRLGVLRRQGRAYMTGRGPAARWHAAVNGAELAGVSGG